MSSIGTFKFWFALSVKAWNPALIRWVATRPQQSVFSQGPKPGPPELFRCALRARCTDREMDETGELTAWGEIVSWSNHPKMVTLDFFFGMCLSFKLGFRFFAGGCQEAQLFASIPRGQKLPFGVSPLNKHKHTQI